MGARERDLNEELRQLATREESLGAKVQRLKGKQNEEEAQGRPEGREHHHVGALGASPTHHGRRHHATDPDAIICLILMRS
jgi:hypothetical protein